MAKVQNPLMSFDATGLFGHGEKGIVFAHKGDVSYAKLPPGPNSSNSAAQQVTRGYFTSAIAAWQGETTVTKGLWNTYAKNTYGANQSGFNVYTGKYIKFLETNAGTPPTVTNTPPVMS